MKNVEMADPQRESEPGPDHGASPQIGRADRSVVWTPRTLIWLPGAGRSDEALATAAPAIERAARQKGLTILRHSPYFFAVEMVGPSLEGAREFLVLEVFQGSISARAATASPLPASFDAMHEWAWNALSFYRLVHATPDALRIESDPLDVKPMHLAKYQGGTLLASRLVDLFAVDPTLRKPVDPMGLYELVYLNSPGGARTLHRDVSRLQCGESYEWRAGRGLRIERTRRLPIPAPNAGLGVVDTVRRFDEMLKRSITSRLEGAAGEVFTGLSGGFDSRLLAATCMKLRRHVTAVTYGLPHHREVQIAREVARAIGIDHRMIRYQDRILLSRLPHFLSMIESQASPTICQITNLLDIEVSGPASLLHGYVVDALAGGTMSWLPPGAFLSPGAMADGITRHFVAEDELGQWFAQRYGLTIADCSDSVGARLRDDGEPYQLLTIWNLENRQRRFIGGHMALLGPRYHLVTPVYSSEMLRAWLEIPRLGLEGRAFYRQMLACLYPATARIPHAEEEHPIIPNFKWLSREYLRWGAKTLRWRLPGLPGVRSFARLMGAGEDSDIWSRSYSITPQDRAEMEIAVRTADRNCQDVLDFSPVDFLQGASKPTPRVCRIAWAVASYAEMLSARD